MPAAPPTAAPTTDVDGDPRLYVTRDAQFECYRLVVPTLVIRFHAPLDVILRELDGEVAAFVAGLPNTMVNLERQHSFIARLAELGMTLSACTGGGDYSYEAGYRSAIEIARRGSTDARSISAAASNSRATECREESATRYRSSAS